MNLSQTTPVSQIASRLPGAVALFERLGIDYCCGGARSLREACDRAHVSLDEVMAALRGMPARSQPAQVGWDAAPIPALIQHIVDTHHAYTRRALRDIPPLLERVARRHAGGHRELLEISALYQALATELAPHMTKEEEVLFPYALALADGASPSACFSTVRAPISVMQREHDTAGALLRHLHQAARGYAPPADACDSYRALLAALSDLERDLHAHIHLENNVLFPRLVRLEAG